RRGPRRCPRPRRPGSGPSPRPACPRPRRYGAARPWSRRPRPRLRGPDRPEGAQKVMSQKYSWCGAYDPQVPRLSRDPGLSLASTPTAISPALQGDRSLVSAVRRSSSTARRSLLPATAAGTVLAALWFVPSARATPPQPVHQEVPATASAGTGTATDTAD